MSGAHTRADTHTCTHSYTVRSRGDISCPFAAIVDSETQTCSRTQMGQAAHQFADKPRFGLRFSLLFFSMKNICSTPALEKKSKWIVFWYAPHLLHNYLPCSLRAGQSVADVCVCPALKWSGAPKESVKYNLSLQETVSPSITVDLWLSVCMSVCREIMIITIVYWNSHK